MARGRKNKDQEGQLEVQNQNISQEEEVTMSEVQDQVVSNEEVVTETATPVTEAAPVEKVVLLSDTTGKEISRSAWIRQEFLKNRSRGDIAKQLGVAYGIVYSATANMTNEVHQATEGGAVARGVVMQHPETGENISRADYCREQVEKGRSRGELAKELGIAYATVYAATKDLTPEGGNTFGGARVYVEVDGAAKPRAELIREMFAEGKSRREIANEIGCDYAVVWAATKEKKEQPAAEETTVEATVEPTVEA